MSYYESIFILHPDLNSEQSEKITEAMAGVVEKNGGKIHVIDNWGVKRLAYEVKKQRKGHYVLMQFAGDGGALQELERSYRLNDGVIKYMTLKIRQDELQPVKPKDAAPPAAQTDTGE